MRELRGISGTNTLGFIAGNNPNIVTPLRFRPQQSTVIADLIRNLIAQRKGIAGQARNDGRDDYVIKIVSPITNHQSPITIHYSL
jgi:hypothetical protein